MAGKTPLRPVTAIVPLKALDRAKGRLADELDTRRRRELVAWMFSRTVSACRDSAAVADLVVVVGDDAGAALAAAAGARVLREPAPRLDAALACADAATAAAAATLVVAADVPLATGADLDRVCAAGPEDRVVVVAPTADGGTGALLRRPAGVVATAYGSGSTAAHVRLARAAGVPAHVVDVPALALDVDTPHALRTVERLLGRPVPG